MRQVGFFILLVVIGLSLSLGGCPGVGISTTDNIGTGGTSDPEETGGSADPEGEVVDAGKEFYEAIEEVLPSFLPNTGETSLTGDSPLAHLFYLLRTFNPETDQGVIDTSNLHKTLWESSGFLSNARGSCATIAEQVIIPPFDFGNLPTTYTCAFNQEGDDGYDFGGALKGLDGNGDPIADLSDGSIDVRNWYGLFGFVWAGDHFEYGVVQESYDKASADISVDIAVWVDYDGQQDYCYRNDIDGNATAHTFTLRSIKGNKVPQSDYVSFVGAGNSEGEGNYYLIKAAHSGGLENRYFCLRTDDGEEELLAIDPDGSDTVPVDCLAFETAVNATNPLTPADLACQSSDFNPGGTGLAAEGTIFLDYD